MSAVDWRGTPIEVGALVVYGASVGRSVTLVEGVVDSFTKSGRVNVRVIRRSYGGSTAEVVHVGADRLTIVSVLPETTMPTDREVRMGRLRDVVANYEKLLSDPSSRPTGWGEYSALIPKWLNNARDALEKLEAAS